MNKKLFVKIFVIGLVGFFPFTSTAQVGVNPVYGSQTDNYGLRFEGYVPMGRHFRLGGNFNLFFPVTQYDPKLKTDKDVSRWGVNINGQFRFFPRVFITPYAMTGINIINQDIDIDARPELEPGANSIVGLNVGGGLEVGIPFGYIFAEYKNIFSKAEQWVASGGVRIGLN